MEGIRKSVRYQSDKNRPAQLSFSEEISEFEENLIGLVVNLSFGGSCLVFTGDMYLTRDQIVTLKINQFPVCRARVAWVKDLTDGVYMAGFEHLKDL